MSATTGNSFRHILYETEAGVARIVLNTPDNLNALGVGPGSNRAEISAALAMADADPEVGCILITANGRAFCAGGNLTDAEPRVTVVDNWEFGLAIERFHLSIRNTRKPVIAAVHGLCLGAGLAFIAQCDFVLAAEDARFGLVEGRLGMPGASEIVPRVGPEWAKFLVWTGEIVDARLAERMGLVLMTIAADKLHDRALGLARRIARVPLEGVLLNKRGIDSVAAAMGIGMARTVAPSVETLTRAASSLARAPDGRRFEEILASEGIAGLKRAQKEQFATRWLEEED